MKDLRLKMIKFVKWLAEENENDQYRGIGAAISNDLDKANEIFIRVDTRKEIVEKLSELLLDNDS